jgi:hypothetical protein
MEYFLSAARTALSQATGVVFKATMLEHTYAETQLAIQLAMPITLHGFGHLSRLLR